MEGNTTNTARTDDLRSRGPTSSQSQPAAIELQGLSKRYPAVLALDKLDLVVPRGSIYGLLGRNGAGKTTALSILSTLRRPTAGSARINGHDVQEDPMIVRRSMAILLESATPPRPHWTVSEYLRFFAELRGTRPAPSPLIELLDLGHLTDRPTGQLSAGQRRRVELARVFSTRASVLLLDEPTKGLDLPGKRKLWDAIRSLVDQRDVTVLLSSHDVFEIRELCEEAAVLREGRLARTVTRDEMAGRDPSEIEELLTEAMG